MNPSANPHRHPGWHHRNARLVCFGTGGWLRSESVAGFVGIRNQAEFRRILGKFYHRPPGGESWCDVILRLRSALDTVSLHYGEARVLIVAHQVVVLCLRYLLEKMTEEQILSIDAEGDVANCAVTEYAFDPNKGQSGGLVLKAYNFVAPLQEQGRAVQRSGMLRRPRR